MKNSKTPSPKASKESKSSPKRTNKQNSPKRNSDAYKGAKACKETGSIEKQEENYLARCTNFRLTTGYELSICNCKHVRRMTLGERHSIVNPQRWHCNVCYTTESVWACLSCPNVACGRYIQEHALTHFQESGHPLVIDVNELYVFCYKCDDYVLNDNNSSDIKVLRETLQAIRYQNFTGTTRSGHTLRSAMISEQEDLEMRRQMQQQQLDRDDRQFTAIWHSRFVRQRKAFRRWLKYIRLKRNASTFPPDFSSDDDNVTNMLALSDEQRGPQIIQPTQPVLPLEEVVPNRLEQESDKERIDLKQGEQEEMEAAPTTGNLKSPTASEQNSENLNTEISLLMEDILKKIPDKETINNVHVENLGNVDSGGTQTELKNLNTPSCPLSPRPLPDQRVLLFPSPKKPLMIITPLSPSVHTKSPISCKDVKLVTVNLPSSSVLKHTLASEKKTDVKVEATAEKTESQLTKEVKLADLNILSRPKRSTAALKYKEIFGKLLDRDDQESPAKRARISKKEKACAEKPVKGQKKPRRMGMRSSDRLKRMNEEKERVRVLRKRKEAKLKTSKAVRTEAKAAVLRKRKVMKKASVKTRLQKKQHQVANIKSQRSRRLIVNKRATNDRKRSSTYHTHSLYDNIPNRAVTSLIPGVTGLRNLGNTCYLNSIIQVLGHLQKFRRCLLALRELEFIEALSQSPKESLYQSQTADGFLSSVREKKASSVSTRRSTVELYEEQTRPQPFPSRKSDRLTKSRSGLNGGQSSSTLDNWNWDPGAMSESSNMSDMAGPDHWSPSLSLCNELDHLYRVMWSGKWKLVSPYHFLHSVWSLIPSFRGYTQQDAQEFLCELLDKIVSELERCQTLSATENKLALRILKVVQKVFEGRLMSRVRCLECGHVSQTIEPFWDLSLEFPERYHKVNSVKRRSSTGTKSCSAPSDPCTLHEMLQNFTSPETLEGGKVYGCVECNFKQYQNLSCAQQKKRHSGRKNSQLLTEAEKQLKVLELPQVIRFHLKRFRWIGRNHREKISVHVEFPPELDMRRYCWNSEMDCTNNVQHMYDLSAVVMHHGRGFGSGHYTANCWNDIGEFWVHCNDSNLELRSIEDVMTSQAYILFYTQRGLDPHPHILSPPPTPKMSPSSTEQVFDSTFTHVLPVEPVETHKHGSSELSSEVGSNCADTNHTTRNVT